MALDFILLILIVRYLKRTQETAEKLPGWDKIFTAIFFGSIIFIVLSIFVDNIHSILIWIGHALLLYVVYILYTQKEFRSARSYMIAIVPYVFVSLMVDITRFYFKDFFHKWENYIEIASVFSVIWLIAMLIINKRQQNAILKEKSKTKEEEEQNKIMATLKAELEVQVAERTSELTKQKEALQGTLNELKATQSQLIQSEKMASLGELTAGIAHEIQNPLNFVNNFSEVNKELLEEMKVELDKGNINEVKNIANDIISNEGKILFHGKRADAIVKGMLQHSRSSNGIKEPTNINALADEYLRLAYHGLRAKDKSFNAAMKTAFDESIENINIIPQDIGRVILNLLTNAFYAVNEKKKQSGNGAYEPTVTVSTKKLNSTPRNRNKVTITVADNGNGIPQKVLDKIFQPFFTTKPTGQGTGLGLSMSYDIITKGHGGELKVTTKENSGTEFIITLPT